MFNEEGYKSLTNDKNIEYSKLKALTEVNLNALWIIGYVCESAENIVGKKE